MSTEETSQDRAVPQTLSAENVGLGYDRRLIVEELDLSIPPGSFTVIVGPNACGKSTLLRALARLLPPMSGRIMLDGEAITSLPAKQVARRIGLLPQSSIAPDGITVADLVARGRYPYQKLFRHWSSTDEAAVHEALEATGTSDLSARRVDELSGGQRQRVWVAMVLAQQTPLLLLDEPTTFLDIGYQIELLNLFRTLNRERGNTVVAVLHDLNHACRYASHLVAMRDGAIRALGNPSEVVTEDLVREVFDLPCRIIEDPVTGAPLVVPLDEPTHPADLDPAELDRTEPVESAVAATESSGV